MHYRSERCKMHVVKINRECEYKKPANFMKRTRYAPSMSHLGFRFRYELLKSGYFKGCLFFALRVRPGENIFSHRSCALGAKNIVERGVAQHESTRASLWYSVSNRSGSSVDSRPNATY